MFESKKCYFAIISLSVLLGIAMLVTIHSIAVAALIIIGAIVISKKELALWAIIITLFLEAGVFSFYFLDARIRPVQIVEYFVIVGLIISFFMGNFKPRGSPIDKPLIAYLLINAISLYNAPLLNRGLKVAILLASLVVLYYIVINLLSSDKIFEKAFRLLVYTGLAEIIYGLYQVAAGFCNWHLGSKLPVGPSGVVQYDFLGAPWGRPYGTLFEPDWYGAVTMFYALLFIVLYFSRTGGKRRLYLFGIMVSIAGLFLSFVRAAWFGFMAGMVFLSFYASRVRDSKLRMRYSVSIALVTVLLVWASSFLSPIISDVMKRRLSTFGEAGISSENVRFVQISHAMTLFVNHPIIGNGPGSFAVQGIWGHSEDYYSGLGSNLSLMRRYNPSILMTALEDTGIVGFLLLFVLLYMFVKYNMRKIPALDERYQSVGLGLFTGAAGLFTSYILTHGFWIPFTWVFLAFNIAALILGTNEKNA